MLMWPVLCFKIRNEETTTAVLFLENNGELVNATGIPNCGSQYIILKSYEYKLMQCSRVSCTSVHTEALSEATVFQLYKNCSFRHFCEKLHFPVPTSLQNGLKVIVPALHVAVNIQYQCTGKSGGSCEIT